MHEQIKKVASCLYSVKTVIAAVLMLFVVGTGTAFAQQSGRTITGKVLDENNQPMPGVTIIIDGTTKGTMTGPDGTSFLNKFLPVQLSLFLVSDTPTRFFLKVSPTIRSSLFSFRDVGGDRCRGLRTAEENLCDRRHLRQLPQPICARPHPPVLQCPCRSCDRS